MKKFFKVVPKTAQPLGASPITANSAAKSGTPTQTLTPKTLKPNKSDAVKQEKKKRKLGLNSDIFDTDEPMEDVEDKVEAPPEEIVISDEDGDDTERSVVFNLLLI